MQKTLGGARLGCLKSPPQTVDQTPWDRSAARENITTWYNLFGYKTPEVISAGSYICHESAIAHDVVILIDGLVLLTYTGATKIDVVLSLGLPGEIIASSRVLLTSGQDVSARAIVRCKVIRVSIEQIRAREKTDPRIMRFFSQLMVQEIVKLETTIKQLKELTARQRLACVIKLFISVIQDEKISHGRSLIMPLNDEDLADIVGISVRQLKRIKSPFREDSTTMCAREWKLPLPLT